MMTPQIPACPRCGADAVSQEGTWVAAVGKASEHGSGIIRAQIWCTRCYKLVAGKSLQEALAKWTA